MWWSWLGFYFKYLPENTWCLEIILCFQKDPKAYSENLAKHVKLNFLTFTDIKVMVSPRPRDHQCPSDYSHVIQRPNGYILSKFG